MRNIKLITFVTLFLCSHVLTFSQRSDTYKTATSAIHVDPNTATGGQTSQFFDEINYIPLETTKESLFGEVWKMEVYKDYFIISDISTNSIFVFLKNGKFYSKIDKHSLHADNLALDFTIDKKAGQIVVPITSSNKPYLVWCDLKGGVVKKINIKSAPYSISYLKSDCIAMSPREYLNTHTADTTSYLVKYIKDSNIINNLLPVTLKEFKIQLGFRYEKPNFLYSSGIDGSLFFVKENDYDIMQLNPSGVSKIIRLVFPLSLSIPTDFNTNSAYEDKQKYFRNNNTKISSIQSVYLNKNCLFFETVNSRIFSSDRYLFHSFRSGRLYALERINGDSLSSFLPIISSGVGSLAAADTNYIYTTLSSLSMFQAMESNISGNPHYPPRLQEYFKTQSRKSNPVIVQLKLKGNL